MKRKILTGIGVVILSVVFALSVFTQGYAKYGLTEEEIRTVQTKLVRWGYFEGPVDGKYGPKTTEAVKYFQRKNGLAADGIVGDKTAEKLGIQLSKNSASSTDASSDVYLLARVVYGESRGEPYNGKVAVAAVVLNRVKHAGFPNTLSGVVYQKGAFSIVADGQINLAPDEEALRAARDALNGKDPSGGAIYYYNPKKTNNKFMHSRPVNTVIGNHRFCS